MCGIFAYSGSQKTDKVLLEGLKNLEYRGYDSAGIAFFENNKIKRFRVRGEVKNLEKQIPKSSIKKGLGIGHTRWATHGKPSKINAHPHKSHFVYVVHNGIIENREEIKKIIPVKALRSETDTELIPHLIYHFIKSEQLSFFKAVLKSIPLLKGSYAVIAIYEKNPKEIIAFKSGPPLILGKKAKDFFISSDLEAFKEKTDILFLEDEEILHLKNNTFQIFNFKGVLMSRSLKKNFKKKISQIQNSKGRHPHFMIKEILEQPQSLSRLIERHLNQQKDQIEFKLFKGNKKIFNQSLKKSSQILILACGSSYFAGLFAKYVLEDIASLQVQVETASEFIYRNSFISPQTLILFISQSGETADVLTALKQIQKLNLTSFSLCNVQDSTLDRKTDFGLNLLAGKEIAVASTKSFSSSLLSLIFLAFHIKKIKEILNSKEEKDFIKNLISLPSHIKKVLNYNQFFIRTLEDLKNSKTFFYIGRGFYYPIALEGALKLKEIAYLHAEAYPSGEMKHGPLAIIDKNTTLIALLPFSGPLYQKNLTNIKEALSRGARLIAIGAQKEEELKNQHFLNLPKTNKYLHPLLTLIPLQMMAYYISRSYGYNADRPRNLAKSVTVE
ncbi:MAG: glutamine--fructose-6-phosphate transaminase (isomerizing) [Bdellovibrionales bacterium]|nr:glutamine--fructose-6-phosphate transaminase (isomerizing) [Bdellovibrionales bacterium]